MQHPWRMLASSMHMPRAPPEHARKRTWAESRNLGRATSTYTFRPSSSIAKGHLAVFIWMAVGEG